jgi:NAD(P)H-dependent FMN reductase
MTEPATPNPNLHIIIASTRPGRVGATVAQWIHERAVAYGGFDVTLVDLAEVNLPMMDEPNHPRLQRYVHEHTRVWSATVSAADAFIFVTPEYNYGIAAPLKNAIDYLHEEWKYKPVAFVSYGGVSAGTRAVQMTKQIVSTLSMMPLNEAVSIPYIANFLDEAKQLKPNQVMEDAAQLVLKALHRWTVAMHSLRLSEPMQL